MKKLAWFGVVVLFIAAATVTTLAPTVEQTCCKKTCSRHKGDKMDFRRFYKSDAQCCQKEACLKK